MEFRWVAGLTLWTVLSGPVLVDVVVIGKSVREPRQVLVGRSETGRPSAQGSYQSSGSWNGAGSQRR